MEEAVGRGFQFAAIAVAREKDGLCWAVGSTANYCAWCAVTPKGVEVF
jgi:hypothetical protein